MKSNKEELTWVDMVDGRVHMALINSNYDPRLIEALQKQADRLNRERK